MTIRAGTRVRSAAAAGVKLWESVTKNPRATTTKGDTQRSVGVEMPPSAPSDSSAEWEGVIFGKVSDMGKAFRW